MGTSNYEIGSNEKQEIKRLLEDAGPFAPGGVVYMWGLDEDERGDDIGAAKSAGGLDLIQALGELEAGDRARVFFVTRQAQDVDPRHDELSLTQAPLIGLVRAAISERPELSLRLIDIDTGDETLSGLAKEILLNSAEEEVALRGRERYVHRLARRSAEELAAAAISRPIDSGSASTGEGAGTEEHDALLPTFVSAYYALHHVARVQNSERVLIHGAASPLGFAAIQLARWRGAILYVTAANADDRARLHDLGVEHVFDCTSMEFTDGIVQHSGGSGVDVVLNLLPGEIAAKALTLLAPFGRFLNMQRGRTLAAMMPLQPNQCVIDIDIHRVIDDRPQLYGQLLADVLARFKAADFGPLPHQLLETAGTANATGWQDITASVQSLDGAQSGASRPKPNSVVSPDGAYLITGGFGGFGLEIAKWLAGQGARYLVLVGRRGISGARAQQTVERLRRGGAQVLTIAADIAEETDLQRVLAEVASVMPPLRGIFHAAAVLDDALIQNLTRRQLGNAMRAKALGAWRLHRQTLNAPLDHFVLFSSIGSLIGNPGQGSYVAANAFLDALAHLRRSRDLPAISINWAGLAQVGMAADDPEVEQYLRNVGFGFFTPRQAMKVLQQVLAWNPVNCAPLSWTGRLGRQRIRRG